jgi:DNA invertase Pin-like site-specific DNA recombinase
MMLIGYARVSSRRQETTLQLDDFKKAGVRQIYSEKYCSVGARPQLQVCLQSLCPGDVLVIWKVDRVARSLKDLLAILDRIAAAGASIRSLTEPFDTTTPMGMFMVQILGSFAQLERSIIRERAIAGQVSARQRGVVWGGQPRVLSPEDADEVHRLRATGMFPKALLADMFGCSESTITRAFVERQFPERVLARRSPVLREYLRG